MNKLSAKWQKVIVWLTGYLNIIAFMLAGGYIYLKTEDEEVKSSAKRVLVLVAGFAVASALIGFIYNILGVCNAGYDALNAMSKVGIVIDIIKTLVFGVMFIFDFFCIKLTAGGAEKTEADEPTDASTESTDDNSNTAE